jgi:oxygen-independent coproporphyrinogen-3 oxidase
MTSHPGSRDSAGLGLYVHIPFCVKKCPYCDFTSAPADDAERRAYLDSLKIEIGGSSARGVRCRTLYFGGGTPSQLNAGEFTALLDSIRQAFPLTPDFEFSVECNPGTLSTEKLAAMRQCGVTRVSLGVQSFSDRSLGILGRIHTAEEAREAYSLLRRAGFDNLNVDLIFGLPQQTLEDWKRDLRDALGLAPEHLSLYGLIIEPATEFGRLRDLGQLAVADEDLSAEMYEAAMDLTEAAGLRQYEISNFAVPGRECRHNLIYWRNEDYLGFGVSAASSQAGVRWTNTRDRGKYVAQAAAGSLERCAEEKLDAREALGEEMMLRLRLNEGAPFEALRERYGCDISQLFGDEIASLVQAGLLTRTDERLQLTRRGRLLASEVCVKFL